MSDMQTFLEDKAYSFVPLLEQCVQKEAAKHRNLQGESYNGKAILKIKVLSPLHIGSGQQFLANGKVIKRLVRRNGKVVIPGSSIKGIVRGIAEAVSHSCGVQIPGKKYSGLENALPKDNKERCKNMQNLCPTCSIFGMVNRESGYRGKVCFREFTAEEVQTEQIELPSLESPFKDYPLGNKVFKPDSKNYGNERLYYCKACDSGNCLECTKQNYYKQAEQAGDKRKIAFRGRKFYYTDGAQEGSTMKSTYFEMMKAGTCLYGELIFQNLSKEELGLLAYALDIRHHFVMKLGYGKPLGYGKVQIELESIENMRNRCSQDFDNVLNKGKIEQLAESYRENKALDIKNAIQCLEQIMG